MTKRDTKREKITFKAKEILAGSPDGIKYAELVKRLIDLFLDEAHGNLTGSIWNLDTRSPDEIYKPSRGLFRFIKFKTEEVASPTPEPPKEPGMVGEKAFYKPFADWLENDIEECTKAIPLGGNTFKDKWGTPDIFGIFKGRESDIIKPSMEIVVAEVKTNTNSTVVFWVDRGKHSSHQDRLLLGE